MNEQPQLNPQLVSEVQEIESQRFQKWQEAQQMGYLNTRIVELGVENLELKRRIEELTAPVEVSAVGEDS